MADFEIHLEYKGDASAKFWEAKVDGKRQTVRFGKIGSPGQTKLKNFASVETAVAETKKTAEEKRKNGYVEAGAKAKAGAATKKTASRGPRGGAFIKAHGDNVTANVIAAKLRGEGKLSKVDPKKPDGFGDDGLVGIAVHPETNGYFAIVDSADGAQGIGAGGWSNLGIMTNHLGTTALWYRIYSDDCAVGVRFDQASSNSIVYAGDAAFIEGWLEAEGIALGKALPPKSAGPKATLFTIKYEVEKYRSGPDGTAVSALIEVANLAIAGNAKGLKAKYDSLDEKTAALALGIIRGEKRGKAEACILALAHSILAAKMEPRAKPKEPSFGEIVLSRAASLEPKDDNVAKIIARLDEIELDAESKSDWAQPSGVWNLAAALGERKKHALAYLGWSALARRKEPHWIHVNMAVSSLLNGTTGAISLTGDTKKTIDACEKRTADLGADAQNAILYNLACVYARAGNEAKALDRLARCKTIKKQNPNPEKDTDFESLWKNPKFIEILGGKGAPDPKLSQSVDDLELSVRATEALAEKGIKTIGDIVKSKPADFAKKVLGELAYALEELEVEWPALEDDADDDEADDDEDEEDSDYEVPKERAVPRLAIKLAKGGDEKALINRIGGLPCAPAKDTPWPESSSRPMQLVAQLVGKAAGGEIDLHDIHVVQIFADMEGDYYEANKVVVHRKPCKHVLSAPAGCEPIAVQTMKLTPGFDDSILEDDDKFEEPEYDDASSHAWTDKVFGVAVGANLRLPYKDSKKQKMRLLLELTSYDDWFLWALFTNKDFSEMELDVVRG